MSAPGDTPVPPPEFPYGIADLAWARAHGFGSAQRRLADAAAREDPNRHYRHWLPESTRRAYDTALTGCVTDARRALYGDLERRRRTTATLATLKKAYRAKVYAHRDYRAALDAWSACMRERGHQVTDPAVLAAYARRSPAPERRTAVASAECVRGTGLARTGHRLEATLRAQAYATHPADVTDHAARTEYALSRARRTIARLG
ncbi:hypothetical protein U9R90_27875 [Streptomyces sp. E11-3]|uniref:hypothetical protein n=1 Tax=Streptomyces sp. E11-3 TaxID=3110112 RepID=UPI00397FC417